MAHSSSDTLGQKSWLFLSWGVCRVNSSVWSIRQQEIKSLSSSRLKLITQKNFLRCCCGTYSIFYLRQDLPKTHFTHLLRHLPRKMLSYMLCTTKHQCSYGGCQKQCKARGLKKHQIYLAARITLLDAKIFESDWNVCDWMKQIKWRQMKMLELNFFWQISRYNLVNLLLCN